MAIFAVHGHEVLRTDQTQHEAQLVLARVARHVDVGSALPVNLRPAPVEMVHQRRDRPLVARNHARGEHDDVAGIGRDPRMVVGGDPRERGARFTLTARREQGDPRAG